MYMTGMGDKNAREWIFLLDAQRGVVANAEARQAALSAKAIRHRLSSGRWKRVRRGVYATFTGQLPREARLWAAIRRAGPGAMVSHETSPEGHGMLNKPSTKIHITVPHRRRPAQKRAIHGVVIHRSDQSRPQHLPPWLLPLTRAEDTVLDLVAAARDFDEAYGCAATAVPRQLVSMDVVRTSLA